MAILMVQVSSEDDVPIFTRKQYDLNLNYSDLGTSEFADPEQVALYTREARNVFEQATTLLEAAVTDIKEDVSVLLPSAAEAMLQELEKPPVESKFLTDLFLQLSHASDRNRNCTVVSNDTNYKTVQDDTCTSDIRHVVQKCIPRHSNLHGAQERMTKLKENSQEIVSMFIPLVAPKLAFSSDAVGMY